MKNPILGGAGYKRYVLVWLLIILAHGFLMHFYFGYSISVAAVDSLVYNLIFASMAPGFWYVVNFAGYAKDTLALVGMHVGAAALSIIFWSSISPVFLRIFMSAEQTYLQFLSASYIWRIVIGLLYYSIMVLIFYLVKYYQDMRERVHRETELSHLLKDAELRMLKSQINPHFIFNSLNSISSLTVSKPPLAQEMVIKLSAFLRHSLGKGSNEMNSLKEELDNTELYLEIEKIRFGDKLDFRFAVDDQILGAKVPNLILQPLFENAIKYGLYESMEPITIDLNGKAEGHLIHLCISNNFDPEAIPAKGTGIGLKNVKKRLQLVYGRSDLLAVDKAADQFFVTLKIPFAHG